MTGPTRSITFNFLEMLFQAMALAPCCRPRPTKVSVIRRLIFEHHAVGTVAPAFASDFYFFEEIINNEATPTRCLSSALERERRAVK